MMRWEKKVVALHLLLWPLLAGAVLKAGMWVDATRLSSANHDEMDAYILRTLKEMPKAPKNHHRRHR